MSILIGHASIDENGRASGGQSGDQTGKEVCIRSWYAGDWNAILRPRSAAVAEKMAATCEILCKGNLVGYDQYQRNTLWDELEKVGWDAARLRTKCETDCSAFMTACARCAGVAVPRVALGGGKYNTPVTWTMCTAFSGTGAFETLTEAKYMSSDKYLKRGDILVRESGHTAMVLGNGMQAGKDTVKPTAGAAAEKVTSPVTKEVNAKEPATAFDRFMTGAYTVIPAGGSYIRGGAGVLKTGLVLLPKGTTVWNYGYYTLSDGVRWLYVQCTYKGVSYTGFISERYLTKK